MINDLLDAAADFGAAADRHLPPIPGAAHEQIAFVDVLTSKLTPRELHEVSCGLGLTRRGVRDAVIVLGHDTGPGSTVDGDDAAAVTSFAGIDDDLEVIERRQTETVDRLAASLPEQWTRQEITALRVAVRLHLAEFGDAFVRVSQCRRIAHAWTTALDGSVTAELSVPGAPYPLEARITPHEPGPYDDSDPRDDEPVHHGAAVATGTRGFYWEVGWRSGDGTFGWKDSGNEPTLEAAKFGSDVALEDLARQAPTLRQPFTGRLFIPRPPGTVHPDLEVVGFLDVLRIISDVLSAGDAEQNEDELWLNRPHTRSDGPILGSITALILDHSCAPCPSPGELANDCAVADTAFTEFLGSHAYRLSPLAVTYLYGTTDAGPEPASTAARHTAGINAVLHAEQPHYRQMLRELPVIPRGPELAALASPDALAAFLAEVRDA